MAAIASIILAAGASRRLGEAKQFLRYEGETLLHRSVRAASEAGLDPIVVITGFHHQEITEELKAMAVSIFRNPEWERGIGSSIRTGLKRVLEIAPPQLEAVVIQVCDQPYVSSAILNSLVALYSQTNASIAATTYDGIVGVPALFDHALFPRLQSLADDSGAKRLILEMRESVVEVPFPMGGVDIDTPDDRDALLRLPNAGY